jgi:putative hydrolase of the HAD superfamily
MPSADAPAIRCVLFDLDGVVRHFDHAELDAVERAHGLAPGAVLAAAFEPDRLARVTTGRITRAAWVAEVGECVGVPEAAAWWAGAIGTPDLAVLDLVDELRAATVVTAILTNGTDTIPEELRRLGIADRFDHVFNSAELGVAKPDPEAYRLVLGHLGLAGPNVLFTDDSAEKLAGAAALGMPVHHFVGADALRRELATRGLVADGRAGQQKR